MEKQYNVELQEKLENYLKAEGLSQAKAAPIIGISAAVLSQYRRSIYDKGDITEVEKKLEEFFRLKDEQAEHTRKAEPFGTARGYVPTSISESAYKLIRYCQLEKGIVVIDGDAGIGKTKAAAKYLQDNPATSVYVKAAPSTSSVRSLLKVIAKALKMPENQRTEDLSVMIQEKLKNMLAYGAGKEDVKAAMSKTRRMEKIAKEYKEHAVLAECDRITAFDLVLQEAKRNRDTYQGKADPSVLEVQRANEEPVYKKVVGGADLDTMIKSAARRQGGN